MLSNLWIYSWNKVTVLFIVGNAFQTLFFISVCNIVFSFSVMNHIYSFIHLQVDLMALSHSIPSCVSVHRVFVGLRRRWLTPSRESLAERRHFMTRCVKTSTFHFWHIIEEIKYSFGTQKKNRKVVMSTECWLHNELKMSGLTGYCRFYKTF